MRFSIFHIPASVMKRLIIGLLMPGSTKKNICKIPLLGGGGFLRSCIIDVQEAWKAFNSVVNTYANSL